MFTINGDPNPFVPGVFPLGSTAASAARKYASLQSVPTDEPSQLRALSFNWYVTGE
jgi:hypothetical protein